MKTIEQPDDPQAGLTVEEIAGVRFAISTARGTFVEGGSNGFNEVKLGDDGYMAVAYMTAARGRMKWELRRPNGATVFGRYQL